MRLLPALVSVLPAILFLARCSTLSDAYYTDTPFRNSEMQKQPEGDIEIDITTFQLPGAETLAYTDATGSDDNAKLARNRLQAALMEASDRKCEVHRAAVLSTSAGFNLSLGWLSAALAGASPLIVPTLTKNAFASAAALATTSKSLVNEEVYKQLMVTSILKAIEGERNAKAADIRSKRNSTTADYTVDEALRDVQDYHAKCSFYVGLVALSEAVEDKARCEELDLRRETLLGELSKQQPAITETRRQSYAAELAILEQRVAGCR